jgi:hypothetical protein
MMFLKALQNGQISRQELPSLDEMPNVVRYPYFSLNMSNMLNTDKIINSFQPIGTQPSDLPIEVEPIEAHINEWYINYGNEVQGLIRNEREASPPFVSLEVGLMNTFAQNKYAII